jgi:hypothetical protein
MDLYASWRRLGPDLLEAGVDTVPELAQRKPENLLEDDRCERSEGLVRLACLVSGQSWVEQAKSWNEE